MAIEPVDPTPTRDALPFLSNGQIDHDLIKQRQLMLAALFDSVDHLVTVVNACGEHFRGAKATYPKLQALAPLVNALTDMVRSTLTKPEIYEIGGAVASVIEDQNHPDSHWLVMYGVGVKLSRDAQSYARLCKLAEQINKAHAEGYRRRAPRVRPLTQEEDTADTF